MVFQDQLSLNGGQKYCRMLKREPSEILSTFIKLPVVIKTLVLSFFECPFYTHFTVLFSDSSIKVLKILEGTQDFYTYRISKQQYLRPTCLDAVSPEPLLLSYTKYESIGRLRPKFDRSPHCICMGESFQDYS